jgi:hypothetical protein
MPEEKPIYGLRNNFDREALNKSLIGKIVLVSGMAPGIVMKGKLVHYDEHDLALLKPYVLYNGRDHPVIVDEISRVDNPVIISVLDCKTLEEYVKKYAPKPKRKK